MCCCWSWDDDNVQKDIIPLKDRAAVVTETICCCGVIYIPLHPCFHHLSVCCSFSAPLHPSPSWILSSTSNIHRTRTQHTLPLCTVHTRALTNELRTPTLPCSSLRAWTHPYTLTHCSYSFAMRGKEPVQTERPWKFNTPSVRRVYKRTHRATGVCGYKRNTSPSFTHIMKVSFKGCQVFHSPELLVAPVFYNPWIFQANWNARIQPTASSSSLAQSESWVAVSAVRQIHIHQREKRVIWLFITVLPQAQSCAKCSSLL